MTAMGNDNKVKVTVFIPKWARTAIKKLLAPTTMSQTKWIEELILDKLSELGFKPPEEHRTLADLVNANWDILLENQNIARAELDEILKGVRASETTLLRIANSTEMSEADVQALQPQPESFSQLLEGMTLNRLAEAAVISLERLEAIKNGDKPTDDELVGLGSALRGWRTEELVILRNTLFPCKNKNKRKQHNGTR